MAIHPDDEARAIQAMRNALRTGQPLQLETRIKHKEDGYRWHLSRALPVRDQSGRIVRWFGTTTDIEDQKQVEEDLQSAKEQLAHHAQHLERRVAERTAKLQQTIRSLEGVLYHLAHDLRAPLRTMAGFGQMLAETGESRLDETGKDCVERIVGGAERMDILIKGLLEYGRLGHLRLSFSRVDLNPVVENMLRQLGREIKVRKATVQVVGPLPAVRADPAVLSQVLIQLLRNALTFVAPDVAPRVRIRAEQREETVRLWVEDNGIGIGKEHWERIFRVFERLHRTDEYTGTGIGLAIVFKGMERMGGLAGVESQPGEGSRFWLELPVATEGK